jgi:hypothetical protein
MTTSTIPSKTSESSLVKAMILTWLVAGTLDMSGAIIVWSVVLKKVTAFQILQGIASGIFGKEAFSGSTSMAVYGVVFHYFNAFCFTAFYFFLFPRISFLQHQKVMSGLLYAVFAWAVMQFIVLPLSNVNMSPLKLTNALISIVILMVCLGLPISFLTARYFRKKK